jgi:hypothetical protein
MTSPKASLRASLLVLLLCAPLAAGAAERDRAPERAVQPTRVEDKPTLPLPPLAEEDDTVATDRPDFSNGTGTLPRWVAQLELGFEWQHAPGPSDRFAIQGGVRIGLPGPFELRIEGEQFVREAASGAGSTAGFGDLLVGAKARLWKADGYLPGVALQPFVKLPTAADGLGSGLTDLGLALIVSQPLPLDFSVDVNVAPTFEQQLQADGGGFKPSLLASASFGRAITDALGVFLEPAVIFPASSADPTELYLGAGAIWVVHKRLALDVVAYYVNAGGDQRLLLRSGFTVRAF